METNTMFDFIPETLKQLKPKERTIMTVFLIIGAGLFFLGGKYIDVIGTPTQQVRATEADKNCEDRISIWRQSNKACEEDNLALVLGLKELRKTILDLHSTTIVSSQLKEIAREPTTPKQIKSIGSDSMYAFAEEKMMLMPPTETTKLLKIVRIETRTDWKSKCQSNNIRVQLDTAILRLIEGYNKLKKEPT